MLYSNVIVLKQSEHPHDQDPFARSLSIRFIRTAAPAALPLGVRSYPMNSVILEIALVALSLVCFWLLDRYVIGCERV